MSTKKISKETPKTEKKLSKKEQELRKIFEKAQETTALLMKEGKFIPFSKKLIYGNYE